MAKLGDFLKSINQTKKNVMDEDPLTEKEYPPFVVNRTLSYFLDTVMYESEINTKSHVDNKLQFDFLRQIKLLQGSLEDHNMLNFLLHY